MAAARTASAIFAQDAAQLRVAQASKVALESQAVQGADRHRDPDGRAVLRAEDYHQDYYKKNPVRYNYYRLSCGRDARLKELWGNQAASH